MDSSNFNSMAISITAFKSAPEKSFVAATIFLKWIFPTGLLPSFITRMDSLVASSGDRPCEVRFAATRQCDCKNLTWLQGLFLPLPRNEQRIINLLSQRHGSHLP
jgi:hypothetical protein